VPVSEDQFRALALAFPEATEGEHMGHPDFRVRGKVFASLWYPDERWAMVKLGPDDQAALVESEPEAFEPCTGAWGRQGATAVRLARAKKASVKEALRKAWRRTAPKDLAG
jgi:hypothetical protein